MEKPHTNRSQDWFSGIYTCEKCRTKRFVSYADSMCVFFNCECLWYSTNAISVSRKKTSKCDHLCVCTNIWLWSGADAFCEGCIMALVYMTLMWANIGSMPSLLQKSLMRESARKVCIFAVREWCSLDAGAYHPQRSIATKEKSACL